LTEEAAAHNNFCF